ncbi:MAG: methyltransferase domain-containing protein [Chitinophagaceae bacterium]|nr:MAG: methyltransferase domain-containing protein [Chitinophagaceae bacterium]
MVSPDLRDCRKGLGKEDSSFEERYMALRKIEGWLSNDAEVSHLPVVNTGHRDFKEWQIRRKSSKRLIRYLEKKHVPLHILEIGCGNGWLTHLLSRILEAKEFGLEINNVELKQAKRIFINGEKLQLIQGNFNEKTLEIGQFDIVVIAAAIQYFPSLKGLIENILNHCLKPEDQMICFSLTLTVFSCLYKGTANNANTAPIKPKSINALCMPTLCIVLLKTMLPIPKPRNSTKAIIPIANPLSGERSVTIPASRGCVMS